MKKFRFPLAILGVILVAMVGFMAWKMMQPPPEGLDLARTKATVAGNFKVSIEPDGGAVPQGPLHSWVATISMPDGAPVENAKVTIDGGMPQHGHGLPTEPQVTGSPAPGKYKIEGVKFNMGGWWVFRLKIQAGGKSDEAEFNLVLK
jgi:hypothetical protein